MRYAYRCCGIVYTAFSCAIAAAGATTTTATATATATVIVGIGAAITAIYTI